MNIDDVSRELEPIVEQWRGDISAEMRTKLSEEGLPENETLITQACDWAGLPFGTSLPPWFLSQQMEEQGKRLTDRKQTDTLSRKLRDLRQAIHALTPYEKRRIVKWMTRQELDAWEIGLKAVDRAITESLNEYNEDYKLWKADNHRPPKPETLLLRWLGGYFPANVSRKAASRWISWYLQRFFEVKRSPGSVEQTLYNHCKADTNAGA